MSHTVDILDGKRLSESILKDLEQHVSDYTEKPKCAVIYVGYNPGSESYIKIKTKACDRVGIELIVQKFGEDISTRRLQNTIESLNRDDTVHGIFIQLPLPSHIDNSILDTVSPKKDVDCFHSMNVGKLVDDPTKLAPATPKGILYLLDHYKVDTMGKHCVIIGKSNIVGTPLSIMLSNEKTYGGTVTTCDKNTKNLKMFVESADILIVAVGVHNLIDSKYNLKNDVVIIDVGINRVADSTQKSGFRLAGDVEYNHFKNHCKYITPVPGGVGPMTVACLLENVCELYESQIKC